MGRRERLTNKRLWTRIKAVERIESLKGAVFAGDTPEARAVRKARAILSSPDFNSSYLPHYFSNEPADFHRTLYQIVERDRLAAIEAARGHAKSTVITFAYSLRQATIAGAVRAWNEGRLDKEDPLLAAALRALGAPAELQLDPFIVLGSCTKAQAIGFTETIKIELEQNPKLIGDWGELVADQGENYDDYVLRNDVRVLAAGMRDSRRGLKHKQHRPSLWIIDDPDDAKTVGSEKVRTKQIHYVTRMVRPAVDPKVGRVFVIANETHPECTVAQIYRDGEKPPHEQRFGAWKKYRFNAIKEDGTPLWPERFPLEYLLSLKQEDPEGFETEYMNNPPSGTSRPFKKLNYYSRAELEKVKCPTVLVLDPALGRTRESDFQATLVLKYHKGRFLIWRAHLTRLPPPGLRRLFLDVYAAEQPDLAGIEDVGFQMLLAVLIDELGDAEGLFPSIRGIQQHTAKELRILSLVPLNDRGLLCFPDDGSCVELERQFLAYPDGKRDGPDVTEMGVRLLRLGLGGSGYLEVRHIARHSAFAHPDPDNLENSGIKARSRGGW